MRLEAKAEKTLKHTRLQGFSLVEVMVGSVIVGIFFLSFFAMTGTGFNMVKSSRENLRATQIMLNRLEGVRLYNWNQLTQTNLLPTTFTEYYDPTSTNGMGAIYSGTMVVSTATMTPAATYSSTGVKQVTVQITWNSGGMSHTRSMSTYVTQYGAQNYVYSN
jgi:prepilin-type N-terminal cleavage/methylation domain-containing protein